MRQPIIHLRAQSAYSLLEGAIKLPRLIELAHADAMPALGLADRNGLFGALEFSEKAAGAGIQPITGTITAIRIDDPDNTDRYHKQRSDAARIGRLPELVLLAADDEGYKNLMALSSRAHMDKEDADPPHITQPMLEQHASGIICLTGGAAGPLARPLLNGNLRQAEWHLDMLHAVFGDRLYVEVQRHGLSAEEQTEAALIDMADKRGLPIVATTSILFAEPGDFTAHDAMMCIAQGRAVADSEREKLTPEFHFRSQRAMRKAFADLPDALSATVEIARRCSTRPEMRDPILPRFGSEAADEGLTGAKGFQGAPAAEPNGMAVSSADAGPSMAPDIEETELRRQAREGLAHRLQEVPCAEGFTRQDYDDRLEFELDVIAGMKFPGYFLIVADFIKWAKEHDIPVGPGRGSGAGSLVAWALTITDLDPIRFGLLFERFLNPERVSMPDFDIDFCPTGRDRVIDYVQQKYGREQVAQIITFGSLQARAVVRDVARVLGVPYGQADQLAKLIPANPANPVTLSQAIESEEKLRELRDNDSTIARLLEIALKLEGLYRHASTHAAGIVIGDRPLQELVPLYKDPRALMPATQFNMKWVEPAGLVKFDFLGLKTLTVIDKSVGLLAETGTQIEAAHLPLDDTRTFDMLSRGETVGIFQLESGGMRNAILGMKPDRFEDIVALVALYRPGPMDNIPTYNDRKHGREAPDYIDHKIEPFLKETFGVIIYQEQVMQIAQELAGYSLGEADLLRRAMGKKIQSEMAKQRPRFVDGAAERGLAKPKAEMIFDLLAKFADYGFNKSHAAAYALVSYQTAWLKANHPVAFLAASMTVDIANTAKLNDFRREAQRMGIVVVPPCINRSRTEFAVDGDAILYALAAIRNVGRQAIDHIVEERDANGPFLSLSDFASRISPKMLNRRALESLVAAGAFDAIQPDRAHAHACIEAMLAIAGRSEEARVGGQNDMFGTASAEELPKAAAEPWEEAEKLRREFDALGSFLTGHPLDEFRTQLEQQNILQLAEFEKSAQKGIEAGRVAGVIVGKTERRTRNGGKLAIVEVSDSTAQLEFVAFSESLADARDALVVGTAVQITALVDRAGDMPRYRIRDIAPLGRPKPQDDGTLRLFLGEEAPLDDLHELITKRPRGEGQIVLVVQRADEIDIPVRLRDGYAVGEDFRKALKSMPGVLDAVIEGAR
jgi:DNA polymerase-3 subunit alpha